MTRAEAGELLKTRAGAAGSCRRTSSRAWTCRSRRAMLIHPHVRQSTLSDFWQCHLMAYFKQEHENGWHSQPQARGSFFHAWAAKLLRTLEMAGQDKLRDEPECDNPRCQARPNEYLERGRPRVRRGRGVPGLLRRRAARAGAGGRGGERCFTRCCARRTCPTRTGCRCPYGEHYHDLLWIVRKFAREQTFNMDRFVEVEHRYRGADLLREPADRRVPAGGAHLLRADGRRVPGAGPG
jgi:hypothetical protein